MKKIIVTLSLLVSSVFALACTGMIVGKDVSADGSVLMARNEDFGSGVNPKVFHVIPRATHKNEMFKNPDTGFEILIPKETFKYNILPDADPSWGVFGEAGFNEYGLAASTTVSASANDEILKFDPYVKGGITEADMASLILMQSKTAREGIELIAKIVDEKGAGEGNVLYLADKNEIWYMEIYTGHQYVAVKVPNDVYAVIGNAFYLGNVDLESKNTIHSKNILNLPIDKNILRMKDGKFHLAMTYAEKLRNYNQIRMWAGQNMFTPSAKHDYDINKVYDLFIKPDKKISLKEVMDFLRYRYENTPEYMKVPEYRPVGIDTNLESHIFQIKDNLPASVGGIMWMATGTVEHSVYLPYYGNVDKVPSLLTNTSQDYTDDSLYWLFKSLHVLGKTDREHVGNGIKAYWTNIENQLIKEQKSNDAKIVTLSKTYAINFANEIVKKNVEKVAKGAKKMQIDLFGFIGSKSEMKGYKKSFEFK